MRTYPDRQESFSVGQISKSLHRKFSEEFYGKGCRALTNFFVSKAGTLLNRSGTWRVGAAQYANKKARLFTFDFADNQAYALEIGDKYLSVRNVNGLSIPGLIYAYQAGLTKVSVDGGESQANTFTVGEQIKSAAGNGTGSVIIGVSANNVYRTTDKGVSWGTVATHAGMYLSAVHFTGVRWVAVGATGHVAVSSDATGSAWTISQLANTTISWTSVAGSGSTLIATGYDSSVHQGYVMKSTDHGQTWSAPSAVGATYLAGDVAVDGDYWVLAWADTLPPGPSYLYRSPIADGLTYTLVSTVNANGSAAGTLVSTGRSLIMADSGGQSYRSADHGETWTKIKYSVGTADKLRASGGVVTLGANRSLDDGVTWKAIGTFEEYVNVIPFLQDASVLATPWAESDLPRLRATQVGDLMTFTCKGYDQKDLVRTATSNGLPVFMIVDSMPTKPTTLVTGLAFVGTPDQTGDADHPTKEWTWGVTWQKEGERESPISAMLSPPGSGKVALYPDRSVSIQWSSVTEADRYHVYRSRNGRWGYVGTKEATGAATEIFRDDGAIPVISQDPPQWSNPFIGSPPAVSAIFQNRRVYANLPLFPARVHFSASDQYNDFDESFIKNGDDAFYRTLATQRFEEVRALVWLGKLIAFTSEAEWAIGGSGGTPVAFDSVEADPVSSNGCAWIQPLVINNRALFVQSRGNEIRDLYVDANGWNSQDLSELCQDLFDGRQVVDWAYARRPHSIVWVVLDDGTLLSLTLTRGGWAWAKHTTYGMVDAFESVITVPENGLDVPWFIVKRGATRQIEKMNPRNALACAADFGGLDSSVYYSGVATATITGLDHLEGREVYGVCRSTLAPSPGTVYGPLTVVGGSVTFPAAGVQWWVGLLITHDFESLDYAKAWLEQKTVASVTVETSAEDLPVDSAAVLQAGVDLAHLNPVPFSEIRQGLIEVLVGSNMAPGGRVAVRLAAPVPLEIKGITREIAVGK